MNKYDILEMVGHFIISNLSYQSHILLISSHLLSSIMRFHFILRVDILLSFMHHITIIRRLQRCWWKLELIRSWEIITWDQFPVVPIPFHIPFHACRVKQQEILQEKRVILILKDCWRIMREILKDWKVWDEFGDKIS